MGEPGGAAAAPSAPSASSPSLREDLILTAVRFLENPKVRATPVDQQRAFLEKKGLTSSEVEEALRRTSAAVSSLGGELSSPFPGGGGHPYVLQPPRTTWRDYANVAVIVTGASYGVYRLCRRWLLPNFFGVPDPDAEQMRRLEEQVEEMQNSLKFVMDSVQQTLTAVQGQQDTLRRALDVITERDSSGNSSRDLQQLKTDINVVKSLLLSRNQFAPLPNEAPVLPAWQRAAPPREDAAAESAHSLNGFPSAQAENGGAVLQNGHDSLANGALVEKSHSRKRKTDLEQEEEEEEVLPGAREDPSTAV